MNQCSRCEKLITNKGKTGKCHSCSLLGRSVWNKGKKYSKSLREKLSNAHKGKHHSPKTEFKKGIIPWNKGIKNFEMIGEKNFAKRLEVRQKISKALKGRILSPLWIENIKKGLKGRVPSYGMLGKKASIETRQKMSESRRGKKSHLWRGGKMKNYPELYALRKSPEYTNIMRQAKERDDFRCAWCGDRGIKIHSDHIYPFIDYPRLRLDINNIQTLCIPCHKIKTKGDRFGKGKYVYLFSEVQLSNNKELTCQ